MVVIVESVGKSGRRRDGRIGARKYANPKKNFKKSIDRVFKEC